MATAAEYPKADLTNPNQFRTAVRNVSNMYQHTAEHHPEAIQEGREWYPKAHDLVQQSIKRTGLSHEQGSGIVAAVSPGMEWGNNIKSFKELTHLKSQDWDTIHKSAAGKRRSPEAEDLLRGMSISGASDSGLVKAHRIIRGEPIDEVLSRRTSPKTNSFASNIHDPEGTPHVTVDFRAHDIAMNTMGPAQSSHRGIQAAGSTRSKSRYEHFEDAYRGAAEVHDEHPTSMQAITWTGAKHLEKSRPTKSGAPRKVGVPRHGQSYL